MGKIPATFDLASDPREESDVSEKHPEVVSQLSEKHAAWVKTGSTREVPKNDGPVTVGHGWATTRRNLIRVGLLCLPMNKGLPERADREKRGAGQATVFH